MITTITKVILEQIQRHAVASYPEECCGLLLGLEEPDRKCIKESREAQNVAEGSHQNRYSIAPLDLLRADNFARERGWDILGVYHSHPNHSARPSEFDRKHAVLHYSYIILSVMEGQVGEVNCWVLRDWDSPLDPEELMVFD